MAVCIPLTFTMSPLNALLLLMGIHVGAVSGGLISATLLKMPGTPSSIMTTFDGHPMAANGKPDRALSEEIEQKLHQRLTEKLMGMVEAIPHKTIV